MLTWQEVRGTFLLLVTCRWSTPRGARRRTTSSVSSPTSPRWRRAWTRPRLRTTDNQEDRRGTRQCRHRANLAAVPRSPGSQPEPRTPARPHRMEENLAREPWNTQSAPPSFLVSPSRAATTNLYHSGMCSNLSYFHTLFSFKHFYSLVLFVFPIYRATINRLHQGVPSSAETRPRKPASGTMSKENPSEKQRFSSTVGNKINSGLGKLKKSVSSANVLKSNNKL